MRNWTPGAKPRKTIAGAYNKYSALMRLMIAVCVTLGLKPVDVIRNMSQKNSLAFAKELHAEMAEHGRKEMERAMNALTRDRS